MDRSSRVIILILMGLLLASCVPGDKSSTPTPVPQSGLTGAGSLFDIQEVGVGENGYVTLTNFTDQPATLKGLFLCQGTACFTLPDNTVTAGESVRIALASGNGIPNVIASNATLGPLNPKDGEIALTTAENPAKPELIIAYLEWGSTPHKLTPLAIKAGLWLDGSYAPTSPNATRLYRVKESGLWLFEEAPK